MTLSPGSDLVFFVSRCLGNLLGSTVPPQDPTSSKFAPCPIGCLALVRLKYARPASGTLRNGACTLLR